MTETIQQVNEEFVRYVLDTYDLPERTRDRLVRHSLFRLKDNEVKDFDEAYSYIDSLATRAELRSRTRVISLDEIVGKTERTRHERIGADDAKLVSLLEEEQSKETLSGQEVIEYLSQTLDHQEIEVLTTLLGDQKIELEASPNYLLENAEQIGAKVREIAQRYEVQGVLLLPKRPIVQVTWEPFSVKSRGGRGISLTEEEERVIDEAYELFDGNSTAASKHLKYSPKTTRKVWRKKGRRIRQRHEIDRGDLLDDLHHIKIIETYKQNKGNLSKTAKDLRHSTSTIYYHIKKEGLTTRKTGRHQDNFFRPTELIEVEKLHAIDDAIKTHGRDTDAIQRATGYHRRIIERHLPYC